MNKRPVTITILACLLIATGTIGIAYHLSDFNAKHLFEHENIWILLVRITAIISGAFMLRGSNWARWLSLGWIAFHLILSFFHSVREVAVHGLLFALFAWLLFRPDARAYFHRPGAQRKIPDKP
jgi:hypothetical protein